MKNYTQPFRKGIATLAEEARTLVDATADSAEETVLKARKRLLSALDDGQGIYDRVRDRIVDGARGADGAVREHPYVNVGIAFAIGALLMLLLSRKSNT